MNLIFSTQFPAHHPRAGEPTGFVNQILTGVKRFTIRRNYDFWFRFNFHIVDLCAWSGKPYHSKITKFASAEIRLSYIFDDCRSHEKPPHIHTCADKHNCLRDKNSGILFMPYLAANDGLTINDFNKWFPPKKSLIGHAIIYFESIQSFFPFYFNNQLKS